MPRTACQAMLDSTPRGLVPKLQGMILDGSFAMRGRADIDTANLDRGFHLDWDTENTCRVVAPSPGISVDRFRRAFRRTAYDPEGHPVSIETGPGTAAWVPLVHISKFMETAVLITEDGGFPRHHGFDSEAIKNSIRENLRRKRFVRGASTITMQLAKNLYLDRGKNLSRKLQEAVLTMYLEQALTKDQIMELYLNVVELGPLVYGIGPAAKYYFDTTAADLSLGQALYISSIMPNPKVQHFAAGGAVSSSWADVLRRLMKTARDQKRITDEELDEGLRETVGRGSPTPQRSERPVAPGPERGVEPPLPGDASDD
jgi:membrane peptidoglycan carboxypeptidase